MLHHATYVCNSVTCQSTYGNIRTVFQATWINSYRHINSLSALVCAHNLTAFLQVLLLMASALNMPIPEAAASGAYNNFSKDLRARQQCIAEITEMIHVSHLNLMSTSFCLISISYLVFFNIFLKVTLVDYAMLLIT